MAASGYDGSIRIDTKINSSGFNSGVRSIGSGVSSLTAGLKKMAGAVGIAFGVAALVKFGKTAIEAASNLTEVQNVVDTAFGDMAYKCEAFANTSITQFGMSQLAAKKTASTYMAMGKSMGLSMDAASNMAVAVAGLSGDVSSFYNIDQADAATKLKGIWTGETEALKEIGVVMTEDNLKAFALSQGMTKSYSSMSQAEKVALRYKYVMNALSDAQGDFSKTSDSWANQIRILKEQFNSLTGIIGKGLIAALTPVVRALNTLLSMLISFANTVAAVFGSIFGKTAKTAKSTTTAVTGVAGATDEAAASTDNLAAATTGAGEAADKASKSEASFDDLNTLSDNSGGSGGGGAGGGGGAVDIPSISTAMDTTSAGQAIDALADKVKGVIDKIKGWYNDNLAGVVQAANAKIQTSTEKLLDVFKGVWSDIAALGPPLKDWFNTDFTTFLQVFITTCGNIISGLIDTFAMVFQDVWDLAIYPCVQEWVTGILPMLTQLATEVVETLGTLFDGVKTIFDMIWSQAVAPAMAEITKIWTEAWDAVIAVWDQYGAPIFDLIREAISNTVATLQNIWNTVGEPIWSHIMALVDQLWEGHVKQLWQNLLQFVAALVQLALTIYNNVILPIVNWLVQLLGPAFANIFNGILTVVTNVFGRISDLINTCITILKGLVTFLTDVFAGDWQAAWQDIVDLFTTLWQGIEGVVKATVNVVIGFINGMISAITNGINTCIRALNTLHFEIPDWVPGIGGKSWGFNIPTITPYQIPLLASGAVIPPNSEFLAVLGDQKNGTNIETPEALLRQIMREELAKLDTGGSGSQTWVIEGSMAALARVLTVYLDKEGQRKTVNLVEGS